MAVGTERPYLKPRGWRRPTKKWWLPEKRRPKRESSGSASGEEEDWARDREGASGRRAGGNPGGVVALGLREERVPKEGQPAVLHAGDRQTRGALVTHGVPRDFGRMGFGGVSDQRNTG